MSDQASRRARWTRQELLTWILHRRGPIMDNIVKLAPEKNAGLWLNMEAGLTDHWATFTRRGSANIPTPRRARTACRLLECAEKKEKITADGEGMYPSKVPRGLWEPHTSGRAPVPLFNIKEVYRLAAAIQEHPKSHYTPKDDILGARTENNEGSARRNILKECAIAARKRSEVVSIFRAAIQLARKDLADKQGSKAPESNDKNLVRRVGWWALQPSVSMRPPPLAPKEHERRLQNVETWAAIGRPRNASDR
jgi:hypothetical protein